MFRTVIVEIQVTESSLKTLDKKITGRSKGSVFPLTFLQHKVYEALKEDIKMTHLATSYDKPKMISDKQDFTMHDEKSGLDFDDFVIEDDGVWSQLCLDHSKGIYEDKLQPSSGISICGVQGCNKASYYYYDVPKTLSTTKT